MSTHPHTLGDDDNILNTTIDVTIPVVVDDAIIPVVVDDATIPAVVDDVIVPVVVDNVTINMSFVPHATEILNDVIIDDDATFPDIEDDIIIPAMIEDAAIPISVNLKDGTTSVVMAPPEIVMTPPEVYYNPSTKGPIVLLGVKRSYDKQKQAEYPEEDCHLAKKIVTFDQEKGFTPYSVRRLPGTDDKDVKNEAMLSYGFLSVGNAEKKDNLILAKYNQDIWRPTTLHLVYRNKCFDIEYAVRCVRCFLITESPKTPSHYRYQI